MSWLTFGQISPEFIFLSIIGFIISAVYVLNSFDLLPLPGFGHHRAVTRANNEDQERQKIIASLEKLRQEKPSFGDMSADELLIIAARNSIDNAKETAKALKDTHRSMSRLTGFFMCAITLMPWFAADQIQSWAIYLTLICFIILFYVMISLLSFGFRLAVPQTDSEEQIRQKITETVERFEKESPPFDKRSADEILIIAARNSIDNAKETAKLHKFMGRDLSIITGLLIYVFMTVFGFK